MDKRIFEAFDDIRAEDELKENTQCYLEAEIQKRARARGVPALRRLAVVLAALVLLASIGFSGLYFTPSAYIDIDVNPSLAITTNRFGRVIAANAYNGDDEALLQGIDVKNRRYDEAVQLLLQALIDGGYVEQEELVSVTLQTDDSGRESAMLYGLQSAVASTLDSHHVDAATEVYTVSGELLESAHGHNVSPARYLAIAALQEVNESATFAGCAGHSLGELRAQKQAHERRHHEEKSAQNAQTAERQTADGEGANGVGDHGKGLDHHH